MRPIQLPLPFHTEIVKIGILRIRKGKTQMAAAKKKASKKKVAKKKTSKKKAKK